MLTTNRIIIVHLRSDSLDPFWTIPFQFSPAIKESQMKRRYSISTLVSWLLAVALGAVGVATVFFIVNALILLHFHTYSWHDDVLIKAATDALYVAGAAVAGLATIVVAKIVKFIVFCIWVFCIWVLMTLQGEPLPQRRQV